MLSVGAQLLQNAVKSLNNKVFYNSSVLQLIEDKLGLTSDLLVNAPLADIEVYSF